MCECSNTWVLTPDGTRHHSVGKTLTCIWSFVWRHRSSRPTRPLYSCQLGIAQMGICHELSFCLRQMFLFFFLMYSCSTTYCSRSIWELTIYRCFFFFRTKYCTQSLCLREIFYLFIFFAGEQSSNSTIAIWNRANGHLCSLEILFAKVNCLFKIRFSCQYTNIHLASMYQGEQNYKV